MAQGTVKWFSDEKGYGFISPDDGGEDLFVHYTGIEGGGSRSLDEGAKVSYEAVQGKKGMQAVNVIPEKVTPKEPIIPKNTSPAKTSVFDEVRELAREVAGTTTKPPAEHEHMVEFQKGFFRKRIERRPEVQFRYWELGRRPRDDTEEEQYFSGKGVPSEKRWRFSRIGHGTNILLRTDGELLVCEATEQVQGSRYHTTLGRIREARDDDLTLLDFTDTRMRVVDRDRTNRYKGPTPPWSMTKYEYVLIGRVAPCEGLRKALLQLRDHVSQELNKI